MSIIYVSSSWAEDDPEAPVAAAGFGLDVVGLVVGVGAARVPALQRDAGAAREAHADVEAVDHRDVIRVHVTP